MDIFMPDVDGLEATRRLKVDPQLQAVPVIAYTARPEIIGDASDLFHAICEKPCPRGQLSGPARRALGESRN
jgi:CheY-like chemotaxis protein